MMAKLVNRLTDLQVRKLREPGLHCDGAGLYLQITSPTARSWIFRYTLRGRAREMGLGPASLVSLSDARAAATAARNLCRQGIDPIEERDGETRRKAIVSFQDCANAYIELHRAAWSNSKHRSQWQNTLETHVFPKFGSIAVDQIDTSLVLSVLEPIWSSKTETANRVRGRIECVLDWAKAHGHRSGDNPARWRGHLDKILPRPTKVAPVRHHAALAYQDVPSLLAKLRPLSGAAARALEFLILTAARTEEVLGCRPQELDLRAAIWTIPAERMKARREHRVPLSGTAVALLRQLDLGREQVFLGPNGRRLSNMAMLAVLKRLGASKITVHGFRSSFRDWAAEETQFSREVVEMALAHQVDSKVEAAYRRGELLAKRRLLMEEWARFCHPGSRLYAISAAE
jgi:integrase